MSGLDVSSSKDLDFKAFKNFSRDEFACKCGCGRDDINIIVVKACQIIRDDLHEPVRVNSGVRCESHNKKVGGAPNSWHLKGLAADLSCQSGALNLFMHIINLCEKGLLPAVNHVIFYKKRNFVHIDCGFKRANRFAIS